MTRTLKRGEEPLWMSLKPSVASGRLDSDDVGVALGRDEARAFLIALEGARCVGRLRGKFLNPRLYLIRELLVSDDGDFDEVAVSLCAFLADSFADDGTEVFAWDRESDRAKNAALEAAGFVVAKRKVFVERDLRDYESPHEDVLEYRTLAELGEERFMEIMTEAAKGDPFEDVTERDPRSDFRELVDHAGDRFDPTWWRVAFLGGKPLGVVLPQAFPDRESEGSLFYVGVLPDRRGHGFGKVLHGAGLEFMARNGLERYVGSTDSRNLPMLAVFAANGCSPTGTQLFYKALRVNDRRR
ncbi:MAG: GNAT family N-acetyltransferase [Candidatus Eisenbacteria bacterium]